MYILKFLRRRTKCQGRLSGFLPWIKKFIIFRADLVFCFPLLRRVLKQPGIILLVFPLSDSKVGPLGGEQYVLKNSSKEVENYLRARQMLFIGHILSFLI